MEATQSQLLKFLDKAAQFVIPVYQRTYSWTQRECQQLWDDIIRTGHQDHTDAHFIGSIVYIEERLSQVTTRSPLFVIDGQQRLTTVMLLIEALARRVGTNEPIDGFSAQKLRSRYLLDPEEQDERRYKLVLTQTDKSSMTALLRQESLPSDASIRVSENFDFFQKQVKQLGDELAPLCRGLAKLMIVDITLDRHRDHPQRIFESMNSTGRALSQTDLIRNFVLMGLEREDQARLYEHHWRPMEQAFGQKEYSASFDRFVRHYLTLKTGDIPKIRKVYEKFKDYADKPEIKDAGIQMLVTDIQRFAGFYCAMALDQESSPLLNGAFEDLRHLEVAVAYPLLLELYSDYDTGQLSESELCQVVRLVESYVFRRAVCDIPTNSLNTTFSTFGRYLRKENYLESVLARFRMMTTARRFPNDEDFKRALRTRDLYNFKRRSYFFRKLENHQRKEPVPVGQFSIEHIMPQNEDLPKEWREDLGEQWRRIHTEKLHTLGNLTLTGYNSEYSDRPFADKRDIKGGFAMSPLQLNEGIGSLQRWDEQAIEHRAQLLSDRATEVWEYAHVPESKLALYRKQ